MSFQTRYFCDGCGVKMLAAEFQQSVESGNQFIEENPQVFQGPLFDTMVQLNPVSEIFCSTCLHSAPEYWSSKIESMGELIKEMNKRYSRNRQSFFESRKSKLKAV